MEAHPAAWQADVRLSWLRARLSRTLEALRPSSPCSSGPLGCSPRGQVHLVAALPICLACLEQTADRPWGQMRMWALGGVPGP